MKMENKPIIVAYGGGTNSTAMLCGFRERGIKPSLILFADTGAEMPHTYAHVEIMSRVCEDWFGIGIETVKNKCRGEVETLENDSLRKKLLPSLAYGKRSCSMRFKHEPQEKRMRKFLKLHSIEKCIKAIGYDAGEGHRGKNSPLEKGREQYWYPLREWNWFRADCVAAIARHGIKQPGKSSCFFCPAMKSHEIVALKKDHPDYFNRAIAMEKNMIVKGRVKGLYMGVPWSEIIAADEAQIKLFEWVDNHATQPIPCGCYDG